MTASLDLPLLARIKTITAEQKSWERFVEIEKIRSRTTCHIVRVFTNFCGKDLHWVEVQRLIRVERIGIGSGKKYLQTNYYIRSLVSKVTAFADGIRQH